MTRNPDMGSKITRAEADRISNEQTHQFVTKLLTEMREKHGDQLVVTLGKEKQVVNLAKVSQLIGELLTRSKYKEMSFIYRLLSKIDGISITADTVNRWVQEMDKAIEEDVEDQYDLR